jgi:uncharacterized protein (DUF1786 family)
MLHQDPGHRRQGRRLLAIDVGAGTTDVLVWQEGRRPENSEKIVMPSGTITVARRFQDATRRRARVVFRGLTMGGGACTQAARRHLAAGGELLATEPAARTFADDVRKARDWGVRLVSDDEAEAAVRGGAEEVRSGDLDAAALRHGMEHLGIVASFSGVAVAAQDHGFNPHGSNRVLRFETWRQAIAAHLPLEGLFYDAAAIPDQLTRLRAAAECVAPLGAPVLAGDTGPAALLGAASALGEALPNTRAAGAEDTVLVNVGNGHTVCAVALAGRLAGVLEHHTSCLDATRLETLLRRFLAGQVTEEEVREDGGHGAALRGPVPPDLPILVTGPNRQLLKGSSLPLSFPAPFGDTMMTGPAGLLRAYLWRSS